MVTMIWIVSRLRLKGPSWYLIFIYVSPLTSLGQRSRASWASQSQKSATLSPQPGGKNHEVHKNRWWHWREIYVYKVRASEIFYSLAQTTFLICNKKDKQLNDVFRKLYLYLHGEHLHLHGKHNINVICCL